LRNTFRVPLQEKQFPGLIGDSQNRELRDDFLAGGNEYFGGGTVDFVEPPGILSSAAKAGAMAWIRTQAARQMDLLIIGVGV
jgi:hypothetical protein